MKLRHIAVALFALLVPAIALGQPARPASSVTVINDATNPVPVKVTGTPSVSIAGTPSVNIGNAPSIGAINSAVTVTNTPSTPLYVSGASAAAATTRLLFSQTLVIPQPGTVLITSQDVSACATVRAAVRTEFTGDTFVVDLESDQGAQLDEYVVGTVLGGTTTNVSRVYETPGLTLSISLTPQNLPTGLPVTVAVWCR